MGQNRPEFSFCDSELSSSKFDNSVSYIKTVIRLNLARLLLLIWVRGRDMAYREPITDMILNRALGNCPDDMVCKNSTVLSCGGIYIPHRGDRRILRQIITTHKKDEPVKLVASAGSRNFLYEVLMKESLN